MGWNILRRKTITFTILLCTFISFSFTEGHYPVHPEQRRSFRTEQTILAKAPAQTHSGPEVYSLDIELNDEIQSYLTTMLTPEGIRWLQDSLDRSELFRDFIQSRIDVHGVPPELLFLPVIESTYKTDALSVSGAAGLWQFMLNSIDPFNMQVNDWMDERYDFWKATEGALRKLEDNYRVLDDWLLALAAYNCGLGRMKRIVQNTGIRDFWELAEGGHLPYQTAHYIPKYLSIVMVCTYRGRNGLQTSFAPPFLWDRIHMDRAVDLKMLAVEAGVPVELLEKGNSELQYGITPPPEEEYFLKVPLRYKNNIEKALAESDKHYLRFQMHTVQTGDTLYDLSVHFGIPVSMIEDHNTGINAKFLPLGKKILIPVVKEVGPFRTIDTVEAIDAATGSFTSSYTVSSGDSFWSISRLFDTTPETLAAVNDLSIENILRPGMVLKVPLQKEPVR
jgi:membrane-bound lytic murein transglycosylase D